MSHLAPIDDAHLAQVAGGQARPRQPPPPRPSQPLQPRLRDAPGHGSSLSSKEGSTPTGILPQLFAGVGSGVE